MNKQNSADNQAHVESSKPADSPEQETASMQDETFKLETASMQDETFKQETASLQNETFKQEIASLQNETFKQAKDNSIENISFQDLTSKQVKKNSTAKTCRQDYSWIARDSRYARIDPNEFPPEVMEAVSARLKNERAHRSKLLEELRQGAALRTILADEQVGVLRISDIVDALPNRTESVTDTMTDLGILENCPLDFLSCSQRDHIAETIEQSGLL